jgi:alkanesulfonate monooxygenase SsuD/methylene tetrahydromethanopterin reductase-like flavin-dependent oxidoreductase (luciferase family)
MFALRTYAITPEFTAMMCESFNEIDKNRIVLNICAGDKAQMDNELEIDGFIDPDGLKHDSFKRVVYTRLWIEKFVNLKTIRNIPKLVFSGSSDYTLETTYRHGDSTLCMYNLFKESPQKFTSAKSTMVALAILIDKDKESATRKLQESGVANAENWTICGSEEDIINQIDEIKSMGATDILIVNPFKDLDSDKIHSLVKAMNLKGNEV